MSLADEHGVPGHLNAPADTRQRLHRAFKASSLKLEAERLKRPRDWASLNSLMKVHRLRVWEAQTVYRQEYSTRVEIRMRELIDQQGRKTLDHVHPQGMIDRFKPSDLLRQAQRDVRHDHERHITRLRAQREHDLDVLLTKAGRASAVRGKAKGGFNRATDRRLGHERRDRFKGPPHTQNQTRTRD